MSTPTEKLTAAGVSIWLDDLSRTRITSGTLAELISTRNVSGVTTNPTIFAKAIGDSEEYDEMIGSMLDLDAYFESIGYSGPRAASEEVLTELQRLHPVAALQVVLVDPELHHEPRRPIRVHAARVLRLAP